MAQGALNSPTAGAEDADGVRGEIMATPLPQHRTAEEYSVASDDEFGETVELCHSERRAVLTEVASAHSPPSPAADGQPGAAMASPLCPACSGGGASSL